MKPAIPLFLFAAKTAGSRRHRGPLIAQPSGVLWHLPRRRTHLLPRSLTRQDSPGAGTQLVLRSAQLQPGRPGGRGAVGVNGGSSNVLTPWQEARVKGHVSYLLSLRVCSSSKLPRTITVKPCDSNDSQERGKANRICRSTLIAFHPERLCLTRFLLNGVTDWNDWCGLDGGNDRLNETCD